MEWHMIKGWDGVTHYGGSDTWYKEEKISEIDINFIPIG